MKNDGNHLPTNNQYYTLYLLDEGWELIDGFWIHDPKKERMYFKIDRPNTLSGYESIDCGSPKLKRYDMSWLEHYGWVIKTNFGWEITDKGRKARKRFDDYLDEIIPNRVKEEPWWKKSITPPLKTAGLVTPS